MKKFKKNEADYIDPLFEQDIAFLIGAFVVIIVLIIAGNTNLFGSSTTENMAVDDITGFIVSQQNKIEEMNKTITEFNKEIDELKSNDYYEKYNTLQNKNEGFSVLAICCVLLAIFVTVISTSFLLTRRIKKERKEIKERRETLETEIRNKEENENADEIRSLHDKIKELEIDLQIKDKEHEIDCIKCKNKS